MKTTERNFWLDVTIFMALLITVMTGFLLWLAISHQLASVFLGFSHREWVTAHISIGVVGLAGVAWHIIWHWDWLKALRRRRLNEMPKKVRANRLLDRVMWLTFMATNAFGVIAWVLHYGNHVYLVKIPDRPHVVFGVMCTNLMIVHLALHWKWIASTAQRCIHVNVGFGAELQKLKTFGQYLRQKSIELLSSE